MELTLTIFLWLIIITTVTVVGTSFWLTYDLIKFDLFPEEEDEDGD